jgi:hypothetical protein
VLALGGYAFPPASDGDPAFVDGWELKFDELLVTLDKITLSENPDNDPAQALGAEEHQRGVQIKSNTSTIAQATVHTDHPFWESFKHDTPAHFDAVAAHAKNVGGSWVVTLDDLKGVDFTAFKDQAGQDLPWRSCIASYTPPDKAPAMHFDSLGIPYEPTGIPSEVMRDFADYVTYEQSTQWNLRFKGRHGRLQRRSSAMVLRA